MAASTPANAPDLSVQARALRATMAALVDQAKALNARMATPKPTTGSK